MKTIFMKIFLMFSAMACMFQGMMFVSVGLGRLSPQKLVTLYDQLLSFPSALKTIEMIGVFFIFLGFILLTFAARTKQIPKIITVEEEGQSLNIDYNTVIDFVEEVGSQDPYVTHFLADFIIDRKQGIIIPIEIELNGVPSVHHVLIDMENTLRAEIKNVFGLNKVKFDFHVKGVSIDPKKKYFTSHQETVTPTVTPTIAPAGGATVVTPVATMAAPEPVVEKIPVAQVHQTALKTEKLVEEEESFTAKRTDAEIEQLFESNQKSSEKPSLISRILWGK